MEKDDISAARLTAIYAHVSTARQEEDGTIENQLRVLREFAASNNLVIVREYTDDGWSGDILARPALDKLRADAAKKLWEVALIYDPDRLARRYSFQELVMDELRDRRIDVSFVTIPAPKNSEEKILNGVRGLFAEYERAKIAERFRLGKLRKVKDGHVLVTEAPYGYKYVPKQGSQHGYFVVDEEEAPVVRMIFEWVANGRMTLRQVVRRLQRAGIPPRKSKRGVWNTSTLTTLLRNGAYIGEAHWGSSYAVVPQRPLKQEMYRKNKKTSRRMKPKEEWHIIPVPALIERSLFDRAGLQLDTNRALSVRNKKNEYLLAGKVRCVCGRARTGEGPLRGKHLYYRCSDRVLRFPLPPVCRERGINARIADELVWQKICNLMSSPQLMSVQIERWMNSKNGESRRRFSDGANLRKEIASLREQLTRYNRGYGAGLFTMEQLREYTQPIKDKLAALDAKIADSDVGGRRNRRLQHPTRTRLRRSPAAHVML
jgi:site-specific DNA recombinase